MGRVSLTSRAPVSGILAWLVCLALFSVSVAASAQDQSVHDQESENVSENFNFKLKTLGGKQFWTDLVHTGGWRIQENAATGHFRLIDSENVRHAWGTLDECHRKRHQLAESGQIQPTRGKVVIVLHGLIRSTGSMHKLGLYLAQHGHYSAVDFEYASTRKPVAYHAAALKSVIASLGPEVTEINFVGHSMGNIVVRHYLADNTTEKGQGDPRIARMVMIGPPNQGSKMARVLKRSFLFNVITGSSGTQMGVNWEKLEPHLATPQFEFGIIAGGQAADQSFSNLILSGKDDFTVSVDETKLVGARDFLVKPLLHSTMMKQPVTLKATLSFLDNGYFISSESRQPIRSLNDSP